MIPVFLARHIGWGQQGGGKVILLTEMSNVRGRLGMELGSFLRDVWSKMNYIKMLARKATVICMSQK